VIRVVVVVVHSIAMVFCGGDGIMEERLWAAGSGL
jgi:hypothetical protein